MISATACAQDQPDSPFSACFGGDEPEDDEEEEAPACAVVLRRET